MNLSEKIMDLRKRSGWSQEELAARLGVSRQSVSKWEIGESVPDIDRIIRMSELWDVSTDYLLKENGPLRQRDAAGNAFWQEDQEESASMIGRRKRMLSRWQEKMVQRSSVRRNPAQGGDSRIRRCAR